MKYQIPNTRSGVSPDSDMLHDVFIPRSPKGGRVLGSSFHRIPSVISFNVRPGRDNLLLKDTGFDRKMPSLKEGEIHESNNAMNNYMAYKIARMKEALQSGNTKLYWAMAVEEMKRSKAFRLSAFNKVMKG
jgi:hypothetical protein